MSQMTYPSHNYFRYVNINARKVHIFDEKVLPTDSVISDHVVLIISNSVSNELNKCTLLSKILLCATTCMEQTFLIFLSYVIGSRFKYLLRYTTS